MLPILFQLAGKKKSLKQRILALGPIAYWPLNEPVGTSGAGSVLDASGNGRNATPTNVTFGGAGVGDGLTAATFNGVSSTINAFSASLASAWNGGLGSLSMWMMVSESGDWTDAAQRVAARFGANGTNGITVGKFSTNNSIQETFYAGGVGADYLPSSYSQTTWINLGVTWNSAVGANFYINGALANGPRAIGTFAGALASNLCNIGSSTTGALFWKGSLAHVALFAAELSAANILKLAAV